MIKKGQVTLFIIIGAVVLFLVGLSIFFTTEFGEGPSGEVVGFESVRVYIESGLNTYSWEAFEELGKKGGYTNISGRGNVNNSIEYENRNVSIGLEGHTMVVVPSFVDQAFGSTDLKGKALIPPEYPWNEFYTDGIYNGDVVNHSIGRIHLPRLDGPGEGTSIKREIESYVEMMIPSLNVEAPFEGQFDFEIGEPDAKVEFLGMHTSVSLNYPINITHRGTQTRKTMEYFTTELPLPFEPFYRNVLEESLYDELHKVDFDFGSVNIDYTGGLDVGVNVYSKRSELPHNGFVDIVEFNYNYASNENPYIFRLAREKRVPVMFELEPKPGYDIDGIDLGNIHSTYESNIEDYIHEPEAIDPDFPNGFSGSEYDGLIFTYQTNQAKDDYSGFEVVCDDSFNVIDESSGDFEIDCEDVLGEKRCEVGVYVKDFGERQLFQTITIGTNEFIVPNVDYRIATFEYSCTD